MAPGGSKSWVQRITIDGHRRDIGLGGWPRRASLLSKIAARRGGYPLADKRRARPPTFGEAAAKTFEANRPRWRKAKHVRQWTQTL